MKWQPQFLDFARYWGFVPRLCRPYRPQTKGKIEAGVGYVRGNFLAGCHPDDLALDAGPTLRLDGAGGFPNGCMGRRTGWSPKRGRRRSRI